MLMTNYHWVSHAFSGAMIQMKLCWLASPAQGTPLISSLTPAAAQRWPAGPADSEMAVYGHAEHSYENKSTQKQSADRCAAVAAYTLVPPRTTLMQW